MLRKVFFITMAARPPAFSDLMKVLQKQKSRFAGLYVKILLYLFTLFPAKWRIGQNDIMPVFFLDIADIFSQRIGVDNIGCLNAVQNHIHDPDDVGQILFLLAVKGFLL